MLTHALFVQLRIWILVLRLLTLWLSPTSVVRLRLVTFVAGLTRSTSVVDRNLLPDPGAAATWSRSSSELARLARFPPASVPVTIEKLRSVASTGVPPPPPPQAAMEAANA